METASFKLTERELISALKSDASVLITQLEGAEGSEIESLRRMKFSDLMASLRRLDLLKDASAFPTDHASGDIVRIEDGADSLPVKSLVIDIASTAGVTGATITRNRKNLLPSLSNPVTQNGITATPEQNGTITVSGTATSNTEIPIAIIDRKPNVDYTVSGCPANGSTSTYRLMIRLYNGGDSLQTISDVGDGRTIPATLQPTANQIKVSIWVANGQAIDHMEFKPMVGIGSAVTGFEPYQGNTYDLTFPSGAGSVTAGTLDVTNGVLTVGGNTYDVTPLEIDTLLGGNTIFADCGDVTVTYRADPTLFASKGQTEDDMTADAAIASGAYFQIGNTLYKATAAIATGETIVPGTNCIPTTIAEALNLLNT